MKTKIKKLMLTIVLVLSAVVLSPAQIVYKKTLRTDGGDISITDCAVNKEPYVNIEKTRILAKNGKEFAITFPESYQNLSIVRNNTNIVIEGRKIKVKEPGFTVFGYTYTENGIPYTCDFSGDVNYYGELKYQGRTNLRDNPIIVTNANKNDYLTIPQVFAGLEWLLYRNVFDNDQKTIDYDKLAECQNTAFSRKRVISFEELLTLKSDQIVGGKLELLLLLQDDTSNALSNGVPGGTSVQAITLVDARTYNLSLSREGQGTVSVSKSQLKAGESATLTAQAAQGWRFDHWEENVQNLGATNPLTVTMGTQDRSIKAIFTEIPKVRVTLQILDTNGQKLADPQYQDVTSGGSVTFQVPNLANVNFKGWKRNGQIVETGNTYTLSNVTQNETIQAVFEVPVQSLRLSFTELNLKVGESKALPNVTVIPSNATDQTIAWVSNDPGIAKIENGKVVGVSAGSVDLVASSSNQKRATLKVVVAELPRFIVTLQIVDTKGQKLAEPQQREVTSGGNVVFQTPNVPNANFKGWKRNGQIVETGGSYTLSNLTQNETIQAVFEVPVQSITVTPASMTAKVGEGPVQLTATVLPSNATSRTVTWLSKNEQVVTVDSNGKVMIIGVGETTIEAKAGEKTFTVQVKIEAQPQQPQVVPVQSITVTPASITAKVGEGPVQLTATVLPSNATSRTVTWLSKNEQVVKVDSNGKVMIIGVGETTIEAKAGEKTFIVQVKIEAQPQQPQQPQVVPVQSVTVTPASITAKVGEGPVQLTATVLPSNATSRTVTWISKNEQVVTVDSNGKVTIIGAGETTIEAKAGEKIFTVQVKIEAQPQQPQESDFPPYTVNLQTFKVNQTVDASKVVWENFPQGIDKTAIKYSLRDFNGVDISNNKQIFEVNGQNLTFKKIGSYFLIATLRDNQNNEIRIDFTIQVNE